jgi:osmotically-inducible protein OsmY
VLDELHFDPEVNAANIGVQVHDGVVTLTGRVGTYHEKWAAEHAALRVYGVTGVANDVDVRLAPKHQRPDTDIARAAAQVLEWNVAVPQGRVKVGVSRGRVALEGSVNRQYQKVAAEHAVRRLVGMRALANLIVVEPEESTAIPPSEIGKRIEQALTRSARLDARKIAVTIDDSKVTLDGNVRSWSEREEVAAAAWATPGIKDVIDNLRVVP